MGEEKEGSNAVPRRTALKGIATGTGLMIAGGIGLWRTSEPAFAASIEEDNWSADDAEITTQDGSITAVNVRPIIDVEWEGFGDAGTDLDIEIEVDFPEAEEDDDGGLIGGLVGILVSDSEDLPHRVYDETETLEGTNGTEELDLSEKDLTDEEEIYEEGFEADTDETNETVVELLLTADPDTDDVDPVTESTTFTVTVNTLESDIGIDGTVETGVESDEEVES